MLRTGLIASVLLWPWGGLEGCGSTPPGSPANSQGIVLDGTSVTWSTGFPSMGSVRYGSSPGRYTAVAYPSGAGRQDKGLIRRHQVRLLSVRPGDVVHLQVLNRTGTDSLVIGEEVTFRIKEESPRPLLHWTMIDVGFGDAHLLEMPGTARRILIDAGERRDWPNVDRFLRSRNIDALDVVMGTHIHIDHIGGMVGEPGTVEDGVLGMYPTGAFLDSPDKSAPRAAYDELLATLLAHEIPREVVREGDTDETHPGLDWDPEVSVQVLNSGHGRSLGGEDDNDFLNNDSIVIRVTFREVTLFLGGDAEGPVEDRLARIHGDALEAEVLKVHHHGVNDASTPEFLDRVNPRVGLIPVTRFESYFHSLPGSGVLERLMTRAIDVYSSDLAVPLGLELRGDTGHHVVVRTDGNSYEVSVEESSSRHFPPDGESPEQ